MVLVSATYKEKALKILRYFKLTGYFTEMVFGDEVKRAKPYPDIYLTALKRVKCSRDEVLVFEDSRNGVLSAVRANLSVIHIPDVLETDMGNIEIYRRIETFKEVFDCF